MMAIELLFVFFHEIKRRLELESFHILRFCRNVRVEGRYRSKIRPSNPIPRTLPFQSQSRECLFSNLRSEAKARLDRFALDTNPLKFNVKKCVLERLTNKFHIQRHQLFAFFSIQPKVLDKIINRYFLRAKKPILPIIVQRQCCVDGFSKKSLQNSFKTSRRLPNNDDIFPKSRW